MAIAFRATAGNAGEGDASIDVAKPTGTVDDDILLATVYIEPSATALTLPSGWARIVNRVDIGAGGFCVEWIYKRAASEGTSYTLAATDATFMAASMASYSGCIASGSPFDVTGTSNNGHDTAPSGLSVTTTQVNTMAIDIGERDGGGTYTRPGGWTGRQTYAAGGEIAEKAMAAAGATGDATGSMTGTGYWAMLQVALAPPAAAGSTVLQDVIGMGVVPWDR